MKIYQIHHQIETVARASVELRYELSLTCQVEGWLAQLSSAAPSEGAAAVRGLPATATTSDHHHGLILLPPMRLNNTT